MPPVGDCLVADDDIFDGMRIMRQHASMKSHKASFVADLYRWAGKKLGLLESSELSVSDDADVIDLRLLSADEAAVEEAACARMRKRAQEMKLGLTEEEIVALAHEGRR